MIVVPVPIRTSPCAAAAPDTPIVVVCSSPWRIGKVPLSVTPGTNESLWSASVDDSSLA